MAELGWTLFLTPSWFNTIFIWSYMVLEDIIFSLFRVSEDLTMTPRMRSVIAFKLNYDSKTFSLAIHLPPYALNFYFFPYARESDGLKS